MSQLKQIAILIPLIMILASCQNKKEETIREFSQWIGKEIVFPGNMAFVIVNDSVRIDIDGCDYKIVSYIDSSGCTSCRMKLPLWNEMINEFKSIPDIDIEVLTIVNSSDAKEIAYMLKRDNYLHPVAVDSGNTFDRSNNLPEKSEYHTFLLDADNKVLAIGNPVFNPKIKDLYRQIILEEAEEDPIAKFGKLESRSLGLVRLNDTAAAAFSITNSDSTALHIQALVPSCDCISVATDTDIIPPHSDAVIDVTFSADSTSGSFNRYVDIYYEEKENPDRLTIYGFIK